MRIALLNGLYPPLGIGGSEESTRYLASGLSTLGHEVVVLSENTEDVRQEAEFDGIRVIRVANKPGYGPNVHDASHYTRTVQRIASGEQVKLVAAIMDELDNLSPDVIHTAVIGNLPGIWRRCAERGFNVVHTLRSYTLLCHRRMLRDDGPCASQCADCYRQKFRARSAGEKLKGVVGISRHILSTYLRAGWFSSVPTLSVIANGYARQQVESSNMGTKEFDLGYIGRIHPTKGIEEFLHSVELAREGGKRIKVLVAGTGNGSYCSFIERRFHHVDTTFSGYIEKSTFFPRIRFCAVPSVWFEPFGRVFIESFHFGVPVLGSVRGGGAEVIDHGTNGFLFDPTIEGIGSALRIALGLGDADYRAMARAAELAAEQYTDTAIAKRYEEFYAEAIAL